MVQGVGFRPWLWHCASELGLAGWARNAGAALLLEVEGPPVALARLLQRLDAPPPHARIVRRQVEEVAPLGDDRFVILPASESAAPAAGLLPDLASCPDCLAEASDPADRRYRYPFGSCTRCGPRYSILERLPWERAHTSLRAFPLCVDCRREYQDPADRRFHAETQGCARCGPQLALTGPDGRLLAGQDGALDRAVAALQAGQVLAVKGLAGYHLMVLATDPAAIARLRQRKQRPVKPLAIMCADLAEAGRHCRVDPAEAELLTGTAAPIVLLERLQPVGVAAALPAALAPGSPLLGIQLAPTPLHRLLLDRLGAPVVATSGNRRGEPVIGDDAGALSALQGIADAWLVHDRAIVNPLEDSVARVIAGRPVLLRRARGEAPAVVAELPGASGLLAAGGQQKSAPALASDGQVIVAAQVGDLESPVAQARFARSIERLTGLQRTPPSRIACDLHPDYHSTRYAEEAGLPLRRVQHHHAHVLATMAEHDLAPPLLGVAWDGSGYGPDRTVWGGEFLEIHAGGFRRFARLRRFRLPGAAQAVREPRRSALGLLHGLYGAGAMTRDGLAPVRSFLPAERRVLTGMLEQGIQAPWTSSAGRLFDAVASLLDLCQRASHEAEAACALEWAAACGRSSAPLVLALRPGVDVPWVLDWGPALRVLLDRLAAGEPVAQLAAAFHAGLADAIVRVARRAGATRVALGGGCFQNRLLVEQVIAGLAAAGIGCWWPQRLPANDGGLALGQLAAMVRAPGARRAA